MKKDGFTVFDIKKQAFGMRKQKKLQVVKISNFTTILKKSCQKYEVLGCFHEKQASGIAINLNFTGKKVVLKPFTFRTGFPFEKTEKTMRFLCKICVLKRLEARYRRIVQAQAVSAVFSIKKYPVIRFSEISGF